MKKVLVYGLKNMWGGLERYLLTMQEQLCSEISFSYLIEQCECIHEEKVNRLGGRLIALPPRHPLKEHVKQLSEVLKQRRKEIDTLYVNINSVTFDIIVVLMGLHYGYRVVVHSHNAGMEKIEHPLYRLLHKVLEFVALQILKVCKISRVAVSDRAARYLFCNKDYDVVVPAIDIKNFEFNPTTRDNVRARLGLQDQYVYGFVGRLESVKNPEFLLQVFYEIIHKTKRDCCLMFVGDGSLRSKLEESARNLGMADRVIFTGDTKAPAEYYQAMDYMIMPSESEGLSMVAIEAQAAGLPVTCSDGRFPKTIALTPLVKFVPLEDGACVWAEGCMAHGKQFEEEDRRKWNAIIFDSHFETEKAAAVLKKTLLQ